MILKSAIGWRRPNSSPDNPFRFTPFTFKDNSFPSGHTTVAFALAVRGDAQRCGDEPGVLAGPTQGTRRFETHREQQQGHQRRERKPAQHRDRERPLQLGAGAQAERQGK